MNERHLAQLRHAYNHLINGRVIDQKQFANGLIAPVIRALETDLAQPQIAWESTTSVYTKYVSDERYRKFSPEARRWYRPYRCSTCITNDTR